MSRTVFVPSRLCLLCVFALLAGSAVADEITRKSTKTALRGRITNMTPTEITIAPSIGDPVTVSVGDIVSVEFEGEPPGLNLARRSEQNGDYDRALEGYNKAKADYSGGNQALKADMDFLIARVTARQAMTDASKLAPAAQMLETFKAGNAASFRFYETLYLLGEVYTRQGEAAKATDTFAQLLTAPVPSYQMAARIAEGRLKLTQDDLAGALSAFDAAASMQANTAAEISRRHEALIGRATCLQRQKNYDEAVAALADVIHQASAQDTRIQAEAYLRRGDCYREQQLVKDAVLEYLRVDVLFAAEKELHAEALYHLAKLWGPAGHQDRATEAAAKLTSLYPDNQWAAKLGGSGG